MTSNGVSKLEDTEMAECDGEKVVTMMDVLQEEQDFEDDANAVLGASDEKNCTYSKGYIKRQALYACLTCCIEAKNDPTKRAGVCLACSLNCHENHELVELYTKRNFRCDCGNPCFNSNPCQFTPNKNYFNDENNYNQNFSGLYCICHRPYPDPESTLEDEEMIQCIICEDWLHTSHLEAGVPNNDQYSEMVCKGCMEKNEFLHDYSNFAVNIETEDIDVVEPNGMDTTVTNGDLSSENLINNSNVSINVTEKLEDNMDVDMTQTENKPVADGKNIESLSPIPEDSEKTMPAENNEQPLEKQTDVNIESQNEAISDKPADETPKPCDDTKEDSTALTETNSKEPTDEMPNGTSEDNINESIEETMKEICEGKTTKVELENVIENAEEQKNTEFENDKEEGVCNPEKDLEKPEESSGLSEIKVEEVERETDDEPKIDPDNSKNEEIAIMVSNSEDADPNNVQNDINVNSQENTDITQNIDKDNTIEAEYSVNNVVTEEEKDTVETEINKLVEACETNDEKGQETEIKTDETKEMKRKLSVEETDGDNHLVKKTKLTCIRPTEVKKVYKGAMFWPSNFRQKLCTCSDCLSMYKDLSVLFLVDPEDTVVAYETLGKERVKATQYEKGLEALSSLDRIQQINALTEYNKMKDKLLDFLKSFKDRQEVVKEEDIKAFFAGMKPKREPDGVYFCR